MSARVEKAAALSPSSFHKRYKSSYKTPSPSSSLTISIHKRYRGTSELIEDTEEESSDLSAEREDLEDEGLGSDNEGHGLEEEGPGSEEEEEATPEAAPVQTLPSPEWTFSFLPVSPSSLVVPSPIALPVSALSATISVDEDQFLEVGAQLELYESILHDHTQRLDALPPTLFEGYDRYLRELYTRGVCCVMYKEKGQGSGHFNIMVVVCTKPKRKQDTEWFKDKAFGFQNPCYLKRAQQLKPKLYDGSVIEKSDAIVIHDSEETLSLAEESHSKMIEKQKDPKMDKKKVITKPIDYAVLNQISKDFETRFVPQTELSAEQAFWSRYSVQPK
nr:hypothetical protein [Tanacetum cinerariifolium]